MTTQSHSGDGQEPPSGKPTPDSDDGYSATALDDHWFETSGTGATAVLPPPGGPAATLRAPQPAAPVGAEPDRVEGDVLRFGPGVTKHSLTNSGATATAIWRGAVPGYPKEAPRNARVRLRSLRRYLLAAVVLIAVLAYLLWQRLGPDLAVESVTVRTASPGPDCNGTHDVVGAVTTNGEAGTLTYRWLRSDGSTSGTLREKVAHGQREVRLHLLWTFRGRGLYHARAELEISSPSAPSSSAAFTYACR